MAAAPTFRKRERMVSNLLIEALFDNGNSQSVSAFPLRAVYQVTNRRDGHAPVQLLISVPKKRFKHAVDRNRVKRQIREAYRQHKQLVWEGMTEAQELLLGFIWLSDRHYPTKEVEARVVKILQSIGKNEKMKQ
ncbi:MAG: ribonuclease P protein component [Prevotella sp.]|nr:ribonuclease P protein component [Prevotella sp.]MBQ9649757.1 ribonuclease P protein component [Prevotella sp.]